MCCVIFILAPIGNCAQLLSTYTLWIMWQFDLQLEFGPGLAARMRMCAGSRRRNFNIENHKLPICTFGFSPQFHLISHTFFFVLGLLNFISLRKCINYTKYKLNLKFHTQHSPIFVTPVWPWPAFRQILSAIEIWYYYHEKLAIQFIDMLISNKWKDFCELLF